MPNDPPQVTPEQIDALSRKALFAYGNNDNSSLEQVADALGVQSGGVLGIGDPRQIFLQSGEAPRISTFVRSGDDLLAGAGGDDLLPIIRGVSIQEMRSVSQVYLTNEGLRTFETAFPATQGRDLQTTETAVFDERTILTGSMIGRLFQSTPPVAGEGDNDTRAQVLGRIGDQLGRDMATSGFNPQMRRFLDGATDQQVRELGVRLVDAAATGQPFSVWSIMHQVAPTVVSAPPAAPVSPPTPATPAPAGAGVPAAPAPEPAAPPESLDEARFNRMVWGQTGAPTAEGLTGVAPGLGSLYGYTRLDRANGVVQGDARIYGSFEREELFGNDASPLGNDGGFVAFLRQRPGLANAFSDAFQDQGFREGLMRTMGQPTHSFSRLQSEIARLEREVALGNAEDASAEAQGRGMAAQMELEGLEEALESDNPESALTAIGTLSAIPTNGLEAQIGTALPGIMEQAPSWLRPLIQQGTDLTVRMGRIPEIADGAQWIEGVGDTYQQDQLGRFMIWSRMVQDQGFYDQVNVMDYLFGGDQEGLVTFELDRAFINNSDHPYMQAVRDIDGQLRASAERQEAARDLGQTPFVDPDNPVQRPGDAPPPGVPLGSPV